MENDYYFEHFEFCLEQWFKYLGVKYISSGLGAIINAIFPIWIVIITFGEKLAKLAIAGLIIAFLEYASFFMST
jgi:drug/metabolite transporter (DMT)-like permease